MSMNGGIANTVSLWQSVVEDTLKLRWFAVASSVWVVAW